MKRKIIVFDDDPTGIQTVHGCFIVTKPDPEAMRRAFADSAGFFFILTNSRALAPAEVTAVYTEFIELIRTVNEEYRYRLIFISRSDSTLRSHFPLEINLLKGAERYDAVFLVPAFFEGGRITKNDTHYVKTESGIIPAAETEYARDRLFGYSSSFLPDYIEEKTEGAVKSGEVRSIPLDAVRGASREDLTEIVRNFSSECYVIINAEEYGDLEAVSAAIRQALDEGKRFLFQSAASFVKAFAEVRTRELLKKVELGSGGRGIIIAGSHVPKTSRQLEYLFRESGVLPIEIEVTKGMNRYAGQYIEKMNKAFKAGKTPVVYTSREEVSGKSEEEKRRIGNAVRSVLIEIGGNVPEDIDFLIVKGGITSHDILVSSCNVVTARVLGQIIPGVPVVGIERSGHQKPLPYIIFPGNVGSDEDLAAVYKKLC